MLCDATGAKGAGLLSRSARPSVASSVAPAQADQEPGRNRGSMSELCRSEVPSQVVGGMSVASGPGVDLGDRLEMRRKDEVV